MYWLSVLSWGTYGPHNTTQIFSSVIIARPRAACLSNDRIICRRFCADKTDCLRSDSSNSLSRPRSSRIRGMEWKWSVITVRLYQRHALSAMQMSQSFHRSLLLLYLRDSKCRCEEFPIMQLAEDQFLKSANKIFHINFPLSTSTLTVTHFKISNIL